MQFLDLWILGITKWIWLYDRLAYLQNYLFFSFPIWEMDGMVTGELGMIGWEDLWVEKCEGDSTKCNFEVMPN